MVLAILMQKRPFARIFDFRLPAQRDKLVKLAHSNTTEVRLARRAGIVLLAADGLDNYRISEILGVGRIQVGRWRERYAAGGLKAIEQDCRAVGASPRSMRRRPLHI